METARRVGHPRRYVAVLYRVRAKRSSPEPTLNAKPTLDEPNMPAVGFTLNSEGAAKFGRASGTNIGRQLAIILDDLVESAPVIEGRIDRAGTDFGSFTQQGSTRTSRWSCGRARCRRR